MNRRPFWIAGLLAVVVLVALATASRRTGGPPLDPRSTAPDGAKAVVELAERLGADVTIVDRAPGPGDEVALLLDDRLPREQADRLEAWVRAGGTAVVADPGSLLSPPVAGAVFDELVGTCPVPGLGDVARLDVGDSRTYRPPPEAAGCFEGDAGGVFLTVEPRGDGEVVSLGGPDVFTNALLDELDNAVLAGALLGGDGRRVVVVEPAIAGGGDRSLADLVGTPVRAALAQLVVAFGVVVLWRARRLGRPVVEPQPVRVDGSELTRAVGRLLEANRHPERAAADLRDRARRDLSGPLGLSLDASAAEVVDAVVRRTTLTAADARRAVADPVTDDATLVDVAHLLIRIREETIHDRSAPV